MNLTLFDVNCLQYIFMVQLIQRPISFLVILLLTCSIDLFGQSAAGRGAEKFSMFKKSTTLVVLDAETDSHYNQAVSAAVEKFWEITDFKFIAMKDLPKYMGDINYSMLVKNNSSRTVRRPSGTSVIKNNEIGLYMCDHHDLGEYLAADAVSYIKVSNVLLEEDYLFKLEGLIQTLHAYLENFLDVQEITRDNIKPFEQTFFNAGNSTVSEMTLFLCEDDLPEKAITEAAIQKVYDFPFQIVTKQEITRAIAAQMEGIAYLHVQPRVKRIQVLAARGGTVLYSDKPVKYGVFTKKDLSALSNAAKPMSAQVEE